MNLQTIIDNITKEDSQVNEQYLNFMMFDGLEGLDWTLLETGIDGSKNEGLREYYFQKTICTDTWVGKTVVFLFDKPACITYQPYRHSPQVILGWVNKDIAIKTAEYLKTLKYDEEIEDFQKIEILELEKDIEEGYSVEFTSNMLTNKIIYNGKINYVKEKLKDNKSISIMLDKEEKIITVKDFLIPYELSS